MRILVVDDELLIRRTLSRALSEHHVVTAESCAEARALLLEHDFDLVLSDLHLPDGVGTDLHLWMRDADVSCACFALMTGSGVATPPDIHVLSKPFGRSAVTTLIEQTAQTIGDRSPSK